MKPSELWTTDGETKRKVDTGSPSLTSCAIFSSNPPFITASHSSKPTISGVSGPASDIGELELEFGVVKGRVDNGSIDVAMGITRLQQESCVNVSLDMRSS
jgi:hypothetical protein